MPQADLEGPLQDFKNRTKQIREVMVAVEAISRASGAIATPRPQVDLAGVGAQTINTANSMAIIFLASSFEEFVREITVQCANLMVDKYAGLPDGTRHTVRDAYWKASRDQLRFTNSIITASTPNPTVLARIRAVLESLQGFVVNDDPTKLVGPAFAHHSNNFKPDVVSEILGRLGIAKLLSTMAESAKLKNHFGVSKRDDCLSKTRLKWIEFYDRRNETVHSLGGATGYAVEVVFGYIEFLELVAETMKGVVERTVADW